MGDDDVSRGGVFTAAVQQRSHSYEDRGEDFYPTCPEAVRALLQVEGFRGPITVEIISRKHAKAAGLTRYFTGKPCKRGHIAERWVCSWCCTDCFVGVTTEERKERRKYQNAKTKRRRTAARLVALEHYSGGLMECACCGERGLEFLTLDHINNDGRAHRKLSRGREGICRWLAVNNFPVGIRVLCFNCNCARFIYGECPHETNRRKAA